MSNTTGEADATGARNYGAVGSSFSVDTGAVTQMAGQVNQLTAALTSLQQSMAKIQSSTSGFTSAMTNINKSISAVGSANSYTSGTSTTYGNSGSSIASLTSSLLGPANSGILHDLLLFPTRFINNQVTANRNVVNTAGQALGMQSFATNTNLQTMLGALSKQLGGVMGGNPNDLLNLVSVAQQVGAGIDWKTAGTSGNGANNSPRAAGFLESVRQGQLMNPGTDVGTIAQSVGGFLANTQSQQQGAFLTGGAFSMVGSGNRAKSISEWAEGILKWFMNQRPGGKRGKPFDYGELMSQNFPGSNMDAWFAANGVPQNMRDYFWSYALGKASTTGTTGGAAILGTGAAPGPVPTTTQQNPVYQSLAAGNAATRQSFNLGGKLTGMYGNMEQSNRWFNELMGQMVGTTLPGALSSGALSWMQFLPDDIRNMLLSLSERTNIGAAGAGILGWGSLFTSQLDDLNKSITNGSGDVGDVGDYGSFGSTTTAGMHPDMRKRVQAMMRANPNVSITSGYRDLAKQQTLKRKGVGRVSGRPSAHTRGMAADLGPSSQYGWIAKNASKFGLKSGVSAGEPWHVGLGDVGGEGVGDFQDMLKSLLGPLLSGMSTFTGAASNPDNQMQTIASGTTLILKSLLGLFAQPNADLSSLDFRDVYGSMVGYTQGALNAGLPTALSSGSGGSGGSLGPDFAGGNVDPLSRASLAAKALYQAGFRGGDLFKMLSIGGRESSWITNAANPNTSDRGLFQINMGQNLAQLSEAGIAYNEQDLFDPYKNAQAAWFLFHTKGNNSWRPWKASDHSPYSKPPGGPGWDPNGDELWATESKQPIARQALELEFPQGYGDTDGSGYAYTIPAASSRSSGGTKFYNTFQIVGGGANGGGGIDVKQTAVKLADALELQMKQRLARNN